MVLLKYCSLGRNISSLPHGPLKGPFPMKNIPKSCKIPKIFILATLFLFPNPLINPCLTLNNKYHSENKLLFDEIIIKSVLQ
jgi:hypothetical protein